MRLKYIDNDCISCIYNNIIKYNNHDNAFEFNALKLTVKFKSEINKMRF